jgi:collagenase-like PrtC family protease
MLNKYFSILLLLSTCFSVSAKIENLADATAKRIKIEGKIQKISAIAEADRTTEQKEKLTKLTNKLAKVTAKEAKFKSAI